MKLCLFIFSTLFVCCLSDVITEYRYMQQAGEVPDSDIRDCQLRANGNMSCAIRFDTTTTNGVLEDRERCEELYLDWCMSGTMDSGYTYFGKSTVVYTPPFQFYPLPNGGPITSEIWEIIPIAIKEGGQISVQFTAVGVWNKVRMAFRNIHEVPIYTKYMSPDIDIVTDRVSTVTAVFGASDMYVYVGGVQHYSGNLGTSMENIRILNFVFVGDKGFIHRVSYRAPV